MNDPIDLFGNVGQPAPDSTIQDAVTAMFEDLEAHHLLGSVEKTKRAILQKTARALDAGLSSAKVSVATANLVTKTLESLETLPQAVTAANTMDAWDAAALDATRAAMTDGAPAPDLAEMLDTEAPA
jgi:shikimate 5-dehydrogenase